MTPLDTAHAAMTADSDDDDAARLRFYDCLSMTDLHLVLREQAARDALHPQIFAVDGVDYVLAFDELDRLAEFVGQETESASLPGRALAAMLAERGLGLGLNLDVAPSSMLLPPDAMVWLTRTLGHAPARAELRLDAVRAPGDLPSALLAALDARLARMAGLADRAWLAAATYPGGGRGHVLVIEGAAEAAQPALAQAVSEALTFSGIEAGALDVGFVAVNAPLVARLTPVALRFDLPQAELPRVRAAAAPGMDPEKPPKLR